MTEEFLRGLWTLIQTAGPFGGALMFFMWWLERTDRRMLQQERDALLERVLTTNHQMAGGVEKTGEGIKMAFDISKENREALRENRELLREIVRYFDRAGRP